MRASDFLTEKATWGEKEAAHKQLEQLFSRVYYKQNNAKPLKPEELEPVLKQAAQLLKITGRAYKGWGSSNYSSGYLYDNIVVEIRKILAKSGNNIFPNAKTTIGFAKELAAYYGGSYTWRNPTVWSRSTGGKYADPSAHIVFDSEEKANDVWADLEKHGKRVYIKDSPDSAPRTYIKIGGLLITWSSRTRGAFSNNPETEHSFSVQTTKILNNYLRTKQDITDQQAASLQDIANTKNANATEMIKAIMNVFRGEQEVKQIIAQSQKINPKDKAKLDAIIAGAKDFKEPQ